MKNQKGVTLMILVITVVAMGLIFGALSYHSMSSYRLNAYYTMCSDIEILDEKIALYYLQHKNEEGNGLPVTGEIMQIGSLITDYGEANVNYNPNNSGNLYKIDLNELDNLTLQRADYYIDKQSHTIYAKKGQKIGEETYYTVPIKYQKVNLGQYK